MADQDMPSFSLFNKKSTAEQVTAELDLSGKTALVTGCNSGLGQETMRVLALRGAHVIGAARTHAKAETACANVQGKTSPIECELSNPDSILRCTNDVKAMSYPLDMLICNAGIMSLPKLEQVRDIEKQFATNHLGHFILVNRLLATVKAASSGRVVVLSSSAHLSAPPEGIQFDNLTGEKGYRPFTAYGQSKLANLLFSNELARRLQDTPTTSNAVHPGVINTNLGRHFPKLMVAAAGVLGAPFFKSIAQGAATQCFVATHPALEGVSGFYFADCNVKEKSAHGANIELAKRLWTLSADMTEPWLM